MLSQRKCFQTIHDVAPSSSDLTLEHLSIETSLESLKSFHPKQSKGLAKIVMLIVYDWRRQQFSMRLFITKHRPVPYGFKLSIFDSQSQFLPGTYPVQNKIPGAIVSQNAIEAGSWILWWLWRESCTRGS